MLLKAPSLHILVFLDLMSLTVHKLITENEKVTPDETTVPLVKTENNVVPPNGIWHFRLAALVNGVLE